MLPPDTGLHTPSRGPTAVKPALKSTCQQAPPVLNATFRTDLHDRNLPQGATPYVVSSQ